MLKVANKAGVNIQLSDIDRSHRVGPIRSGKRAILVKFTSYRARQQLFAIRKDLRKIDHYRDVYKNEDLTARRSKILFTARHLVRAKQLKAAYSGDGKIFTKDNDDVKHHIKSETDLIQYDGVDPRPADDDEVQRDGAVGTA